MNKLLFNNPLQFNTDQYFNNVTMLLNGDSLIDLSNLKNPLTVSGTVNISTSIKKTGTGSMYFGGGASILTAPDNDALHQFRSGDFTVESWVYPIAYTTNYGNGIYFGYQICGDNAHWSTTNWLICITNATSNGGNYLGFYAENPGSVNVISTASIPLNGWTHVAVCRASGTLRLFVNGLVSASIADSSTYKNIGYPFSVGNDSNLYSPLTGYIDDLRVTKGVARYTANFTPPTQSFPTQ